MRLPAGFVGGHSVAGERWPVRATCNVEHERSDDEEEIEFQIKWPTK